MSTPTTGQQPTPTPPDNLEGLLVVQAAALLALESAGVYATTASVGRALASFTRSANGRWLLAGQHPTSTIPLPPAERERVTQTLIAELRTIAIEVEQELPAALREQAVKALEMGAVHAGEQIGLTIDPASVVLDPIAEALIENTPKATIEHLDRAGTLIEQAQTGEQLQAAVAEADRATKTAGTGAQYLTNHVANDVPRQLAVRLGEQLLWIAERDACVVCLALAGHLSDPNEGVTFDEEATFGPYTPPSIWPYGMPLLRPPRHPHCRCQVCIWLGSAPGQPDLPSRLRHEAKRSILKGWSQPSESNRVRLKAAQKLLDTGGGGLPRSVQEESRRAVHAGKFTSHSVPHPERPHPVAAVPDHH